MDFLIGSFTGLLLIILFRFFEKKRVARLGKLTAFFFLFVVICSFLMHASEEFSLWLIASLLLYSVLDDMKTKTLNIYVPIIATLLFFFFLEKPYFFLYSFFFFFCLLGLTKLTKEKFIGEGDIYVFLPLSVLLLTNLPAFEWIFVVSQWFYALVLSVLLVAFIGIPLKLFHVKIDELAFAPFLVIGSLLAYNGETWVGIFASFLLGSVAILYLIWLAKMAFYTLSSYLKKKKHAKKE